MRFERLDLNLLVALDALIEDCSVSLAAQRLFLSQPAVSGALNRLRKYFEDDLLVPSGRQMILTPKAEELRKPVREALMFIKSRITTPLEFDPATAERHFSIITSDYAYNTLIAGVLADCSRIAPGLSFDIESTSRVATERFDRGEADLLLTLRDYMLEGHPHEPLYVDRHAVICCAEGVHRDGVSAEAFVEAGHAVVFFGRERSPAFTEIFFSQQGIDRKIKVRVPTFSALPHAVIGTDRIATMYRRHAEYFARQLPIIVHEPPVTMPTIREDLQWHRLRTADEGLKWLIAFIRAHAERMVAPSERDHDNPNSRL